MKRLEESKFFPHVAWATVIGFAIFTYNLTTRVNEELGSINSGIENIGVRLDRIEDRVNGLPQQPTTTKAVR